MLDGLGRLASSLVKQRWAPLALLTLLVLVVGGYASIKTDVFLTGLNLRHILYATAPLSLVTMAQLTVLMVRGFDISVGSVMSLTVVIGSFLIAGEIGAAAILFGTVVCLLVGLLVGLVNGGLVRFAGINSVITTIATLSVIQGVALDLRPSPLGTISDDFMDLLRTRVGFVPISFVAIVAAAVAADIWLYRTRGGLKMRAAGFREEAAKRNGVHVDVVHLCAYAALRAGRRAGGTVPGLGGRRRPPGYRGRLYPAQHRGGGPRRRLARRRARILSGRRACRALLRADDQYHHPPRPQHRRRHDRERRADAVRRASLLGSGALADAVKGPPAEPGVPL